MSELFIREDLFEVPKKQPIKIEKEIKNAIIVPIPADTHKFVGPTYRKFISTYN